MQLSENFNLKEFSDSPTANALGIDNSIPSELVPNVQALVDNVIQPARNIAGAISINSGYRCKELNEKVGGVETSQHRKAEAADLKPKDISPIELARIINVYCPYDQLIVYPTFVHVSYKRGGGNRGEILYNKSYKGAKV